MNNENKTYCKPTYKCGICGKEYDKPVDRAKCEIACTEKKEEEERKAAETKKEIEYAARKAEVDMAYEKFLDLRRKMVKDYGSYEYRTVRNTVRNSERYLPFSLMW